MFPLIHFQVLPFYTIHLLLLLDSSKSFMKLILISKWHEMSDCCEIVCYSVNPIYFSKYHAPA